MWVVQQTARRRSRLAATATLQAQQLMQNVRLTQLAQELCRQVLQPGDTAVDATCGNGHDTAFLAAAVGSSGTVHAFDIQQAALDQTRAAVGGGTSSLPVLQFHLASHADMLQHVETSCARVVMFNLGYLPGSDKGTTTQVDSTLAAVQAACEVLQTGGLCSILCYTGHPGGSIGTCLVECTLLWSACCCGVHAVDPELAHHPRCAAVLCSIHHPLCSFWVPCHRGSTGV